MKNWIFLRGEWDGNNKYNYKRDLDFWCSLFGELAKHDMGNIWYKGIKKSYSQKFIPINSRSISTNLKDVTHVFCRGGFPFYIPILQKLKNAYKIRYSAGNRIYPEKDIHYDLILVDSEAQKKKVLKKFPGENVQVFFKPSANHFKPMDVEKKFDVGFVAAIPEDQRKRVKWVYKTLPKHLKVLQLGHTPKKFKVPANVKIKHVKSDKMPKLINQCKVIIAPYTDADSGPRIISESLACDVRPFILDTVQHCYGHHFTFTKEEIWPAIIKHITETEHKRDGEIAKHYNEHFSMGKAVSHLRGLMCE